jgi:hypothetical protein
MSTPMQQQMVEAKKRVQAFFSSQEDIDPLCIVMTMAIESINFIAERFGLDYARSSVERMLQTIEERQEALKKDQSTGS